MIAATVIAIMLIFGFGGGSFGELMTEYVESPIKSVIVEDERRDLALEELSYLEDAVDLFNDGVKKDIKQFHKLVENYDSTPEEFDGMFSSVIETRQQEIDNIWERRSTMLQHIHADEWQTIVSLAKMEAEEDAR